MVRANSGMAERVISHAVPGITSNRECIMAKNNDVTKTVKSPRIDKDHLIASIVTLRKALIQFAPVCSSLPCTTVMGGFEAANACLCPLRWLACPEASMMM